MTIFNSYFDITRKYLRFSWCVTMVSGTISATVTDAQEERSSLGGCFEGGSGEEDAGEEDLKTAAD